MSTGRSLSLVSCLAILSAAGCSGSNVFTSRQSTMGTLKASVSQLEFENEKLRKEVGELKADNSRLDNRLVQEEQANGEITARLDDAKELLRRQGANPQTLGSSSKTFEDDVPPPAATPKSRRIRGNRTPPPASIRPLESDPGEDLSLAPPSRKVRDLGADDSDDDRWLPIARGLPSQVRQ